MGTRRWTLSTFVGCCIWILHGLRAAAAIPVTTEEPFTVGTASPIAADTEWPRALVTGTAETNTAAADAEMAESILEGSSVSPTVPAGGEPGALVTAASSYSSTTPTSTNVTKPLNTYQDNERGLAAPTAATTAASISTQHPAVTPEVDHDVTGPAPNVPLGTTPVFADVKGDVLVDVAREGADLDPTVGDVVFSSTSPLAITWGPQPTAGSAVGAGVTVLLSQGPTTDTGTVEEGVTLPVGIQSETSASSSSPGAGKLLKTQQDGAVSRAVGSTLEPLGEITLAAKESPSASVPGEGGDAVNGAFSTASASHLPPESVTVLETVGNPGESSLLPGQAVLSPAASLAPASSGDGQGAPGTASDTPGSAPLLAVSEAPAVIGDKVTSLLAPGAPTDAQTDVNPPALTTVLPRGDTGAADLAEPSLQPAPWQSPAGEQPLLPPAALPFLTDTSSSPGAAYPPPGTGTSTLPAADNGTEMPVSPDLAAPGAPVSPSAGGSQQWGMAAGAPQGAEGPGTGLNSVLDAPNPASFIPDGLAWPTSGVPAQGTEGSGDTAQSGRPAAGSPYADTQSDTSPSTSSAQDTTNTGEMPAGGTGALANPELSLPSALGGGAGAEAAPALGQVSPSGPAIPGSARLEPDLSGTEGVLPGESPSASGAAYPPPGAAAGPVSAAETPASPDLGAAQGAPVPLSFGGPQPWGVAAGAPQGAGAPGADGPGSGLNSAWDAPSSASNGPVGPPLPALGGQLGTNPGLLGVERLGAGTAGQTLGGVGSGTGFGQSLSAAAGTRMASGMDQLPGAGSSSDPASPSDAVAASSTSDTASSSALGGVSGAPVAPQPSLGAGPGIPPAVGEGVGEAAGDRRSPEQSQVPTGEGPAVSGAPDGETGAVLHSGSSSPSMEESSSLGMAGQSAHGTSLPGGGGASSGLSTGLEATGPEELPVSAPGIQGKTSFGLSDAKLSQVDVVELPGGALVNGSPFPSASLGGATGAIVQIASGALAPSALAAPQETQPLVPVAPNTKSISDGTATSLADALLLPGRGLSSGLAPNTQGGNTLRAPGGLVGDARGAQPWSSEDEVASGMPAPLREASPHALTSPSAALALPSAQERENSAVVASPGPELSALLSARESMVGSSAGGRGGLGTATAGGAALLLPPHHAGGPGVPSWDANSPVPGEASAMLPAAMAGWGDTAQLLPGAAGAGAVVETPAGSPVGWTPGLSNLPPARITAGTPGSKVPGPGPASGGSSPATPQSFLGGKVATSLANRAPAAGGSSLPTAFPGQGGAHGVSPATMQSPVSCSPAAGNRVPPAPLPGGREVPLRPGAATATSRTSSPMFPAPPGGSAATPALLPGPTVPAVPLYAYGARENDLEYVQRRVDFTSPLFKPETGFPFGRTLRDSLYFTDNGQIIFPASDNSIFTYPNPPPSGFNGHEEVPVIAVFWDNADFSRGVGTTFYQEFLTLNTAKPPFVRDVEAKIRRYLGSSYSAAWTLKITWEKAPAYAARTDTWKTITYQAILTTDGFRSYVLMLYQEGGMQWDYTRLTATNVLIGYTSGDGFYRNDDLTQRPPAAKYRPDQFRGYNTDLRGLWIYKLESRVGVNYRLKCLAWIERQQEPRTWSQGLPTCPCSLQQGQQDPRFKSSRGGRWAARVSMLHSASPNQHGASVRCLYNSQSQLIEGRQERYWRPSRQASPYRDQELKLYDWCCNQAGSARLCAHYGEKRPKIGCDGYHSPGMAGSSEEEESDSEEQRDGEDE